MSQGCVLSWQKLAMSTLDECHQVNVNKLYATEQLFFLFISLKVIVNFKSPNPNISILIIFLRNLLILQYQYNGLSCTLKMVSILT